MDFTLQEWQDGTTVLLDAEAPRLWKPKAMLLANGKASERTVNFVLSDDQPLGDVATEGVVLRSLGDQWLQGHMAIGVVHFLLDEDVELNL